jgi:hypothetical protein
LGISVRVKQNNSVKAGERTQSGALNWSETGLAVFAVRQELRAGLRARFSLGGPNSVVGSYCRDEIRSLCRVLRKLGYVAARSGQPNTFRMPNADADHERTRHRLHGMQRALQRIASATNGMCAGEDGHAIPAAIVAMATLMKDGDDFVLSVIEKHGGIATVREQVTKDCLNKVKASDVAFSRSL